MKELGEKRYGRLAKELGEKRCGRLALREGSFGNIFDEEKSLFPPLPASLTQVSGESAPPSPRTRDSPAWNPFLLRVRNPNNNDN